MAKQKNLAKLIPTTANNPGVYHTIKDITRTHFISNGLIGEVKITPNKRERCVDLYYSDKVSLDNIALLQGKIDMLKNIEYPAPKENGNLKPLKTPEDFAEHSGYLEDLKKKSIKLEKRVKNLSRQNNQKDNEIRILKSKLNSKDIQIEKAYKSTSRESLQNASLFPKEFIKSNIDHNVELSKEYAIILRHAKKANLPLSKIIDLTKNPLAESEAYLDLEIKIEQANEALESTSPYVDKKAAQKDLKASEKEKIKLEKTYSDAAEKITKLEKLVSDNPADREVNVFLTVGKTRTKSYIDIAFDFKKQADKEKYSKLQQEIIEYVADIGNKLKDYSNPLINVLRVEKNDEAPTKTLRVVVEDDPGFESLGELAQSLQSKLHNQQAKKDSRYVHDFYSAGIRLVVNYLTTTKGIELDDIVEDSSPAKSDKLPPHLNKAHLMRSVLAAYDRNYASDVSPKKSQKHKKRQYAQILYIAEKITKQGKRFKRSDVETKLKEVFNIELKQLTIRDNFAKMTRKGFFISEGKGRATTYVLADKYMK